jgi:hypothetical protein
MVWKKSVIMGFDIWSTPRIEKTYWSLGKSEWGITKVALLVTLNTAQFPLHFDLPFLFLCLFRGVVQ